MASSVVSPVQSAPPTPAQRTAIEEHPIRSAEMLMAAGVTDKLWLTAIEQHHERTDGTGYPNGRGDVAEFAQALHYVDVFTAKLSARSSRVALMPNVAAREIFTSSAGHPLAAALNRWYSHLDAGRATREARR